MIRAEGIKNSKLLAIEINKIDQRFVMLFNGKRNFDYELELMQLTVDPLPTAEMQWVTEQEQKYAVALCGRFFDRAAKFVELTDNEVTIEDG